MAAIVSAWAKPGAWALDSEENELDLLQQHKDETSAAAALTGNNHSTAALSDFPALSAAASTKTKKKKAQAISLAEFTTYGGAKPTQTKGLTHEEMIMLPSGPRERTAEELDRSRLGGGFRSYGSNNNSESRWGNNNNSRGGSDEPRRQGSFGRESNKEIAPSRADEIDDWAAAKKSSGGGGFERRERGERGGFFDNSQSRADESDSWVSNKSFVPSEGRRFDRRGGIFEPNGGGADSDNWGKKKEVEGRRFGAATAGSAFDSLRERRGGEFVNGGADADSWGKRREDGNGSGRPRLNLQPRKVPIGDEQQNGVAATVKPKGSNPFGDARPREEVLKEKGQDWKEVDEKLESVKINESGLTDGPTFGKRSFGSGNGRMSSLPDDRSERSWRKTVSVDVRPQSAGKPENGLAEEAENGLAEDAENGIEV